MSGILALLDDVSAIAKLAAAQLDDIGAATAKAGSKAAGVVIDDAAVTPKYVAGLPASRELPIIWKIARASAFNKTVILLPIAILLSTFAPWMLTPLLMIGGAYLCFEGAEKIWHAVHAGEEEHSEAKDARALSAAHLEERRVKGAIKTDFILSAEIMTISLSAIDADQWWTEALVLAAVAIMITAGVYGAVALLVKADDIGLKMADAGRLSITRGLGTRIVKAMPRVMTLISVVGTAAMLWVGGNIIVHGLEVLGWHAPYDLIHHAAVSVGSAVQPIEGLAIWVVTATLDGLVGLSLGFVLLPLIGRVLVPLVSPLFPEKNASAKAG